MCLSYSGMTHRDSKGTNRVFSDKESTVMLWTILVVLVVLWLIGFLGGFAGNLVHLLLVVALVVLVINLLSGRRTI
jgi:hypothetical protein